MALEIHDASGRSASHFSSNFQVSMQMPSGSINPLNGNALIVGDTIPVWSYNENSGEWKFESQGQIVSESGGYLNISYASNHLSYYNLDWKTNTCSQPANIRIVGAPSGAPIQVVIRSTAPGFGYQFQTSDLSLVLRRVPSGIPVVLSAYYNGQIIGNLSLNNLCISGEIDFPVNFPASAPSAPAINFYPVQARATCATPFLSDSNIDGYVFYRKNGCTVPFCSFQFGGSIVSGQTNIPYAIVGTTYEVLVTSIHPTLGQKSTFSTFTASSGGSASVDVDYCDVLTGSPASPPTPAPNGIEDLAQWNKRLDVNNITNEAYAITVDLAGNIYVGGTSLASNRVGWGVKKFQPNGTEITAGWDKSITVGNGGTVKAFLIDDSNNVYVAGTARYVTNAQLYPSWRIKKFDSAGNEITSGWDKLINVGTPNMEIDLTGIAKDSSGNIYIAGWADFGSTMARAWWVKKFSPSGVEDTANWDKKIDGSGIYPDSLYSIFIDPADNVYLAGTESQPSQARWWIKKFNSNGVEDTVNWNKLILHPNPIGGEAYAMTGDAFGNIYIGGYGRGVLPNPSTAWWVKKFDNNGVEDTVNWNKAFPISGAITTMQTDLSGNLYIGGWGNNLVSQTSGVDWVIKKISPSGAEYSTPWNKIFDGNSNEDNLRQIMIGNASVFAVGTAKNIVGSTSNSDWWIKRFY
ncbi:hypothetical protein CH373_01890 [Leptospira perolatii]|uniref:Uncharacterized protein n=1 Tax=Leptospira perolatii TaxID=2023191 RepID=A0A2M9ZRW7_9LEPT|nr:hypothetical protein [Leptospira perolatii]PJZ71278.1 hypothetical protein CH360_01890 [Leptospira perolatii]PJZ74812.1 hypothetical protein CH373_01890 [Leptospira perolatii]